MPFEPSSLRGRAALLGLLLAALATSPAAAQEDLEELLDDFDEDVEGLPEAAEADSQQRFWELDGSLQLSSSYAYDHASRNAAGIRYRGLVKLQTQLSVRLDIDLPRSWQARIGARAFYDFAYALEGRDEFSDEVRDVHQDELELQELWIRGSLRSDLDLKVGRQIVNWGRSETIRVLDVLNPLDNREPGLVDIEDLRLPIAMTRLDYYRGSWNLTGIAIHETRFDEAPVFGSEFYPFAIPPPGEKVPGNGGHSTEYALALHGTFTGWDLSLHWARFFDDAPHSEILLPSLQRISRHSRLSLLGASANWVQGSWLLKTETAYLRGIDLLRVPGVTSEEKSRYDVLVGFEYSGLTDTTITLEVANRHIAGFDDRFGLAANLLPLLAGAPLIAQRNQVETALRYTAEFLNARLRVTCLALLVGKRAEDGGILRFNADYELRDALSIGAGLVLYRGGDLSTFSGIKHADRLFFNVKYSF